MLRFSVDIEDKKIFRSCSKTLIFLLCAHFALPMDARASDSPNMLQQVSYEKKMEFARRFVAKMNKGYNNADEYLARTIYNENIDENILPDGEMLLLQPVLPENIRVEGVILGQVHNGKILVSLSDFSSVLGLSIILDGANKSASGWYIRESKTFVLDGQTETVRTDQGDFEISEDVIFEDNDILVPIIELGQWVGFKFDPVVSSQELKITPSQSLPLQERMLRRRLDLTSRQIPPPSLPLQENDYEAIALPAIDVVTDSTYRKQGGAQEGNKRTDVNIRSVGDFAHGTLTTQAIGDNVDGVRNVRVNYKRESIDSDLLGPLNARKFEVGDVTTVKAGLGDEVVQEMGVHVTNIDPLKSYSSPTTVISGYAFSGWDVELYRETQLLGFKEVDENGFYSFDDVSLFASDNNFRLVFYGPQGEVREESLFIPIDQNRLSNSGGAYDVSLTFDNKQTYQGRKGFTDDDEGAPNFSARVEYPILDGTGISAGIRSSEQDQERNNVLSAGVSTTVRETLLNFDVAVDDEGENAAELVARRDFGEHDFSNTLTWMSPNFDTLYDGDKNDIGSLENRALMIGPLPTPSFMQRQIRYNASLGVTEFSDGDGATQSTVGISGGISRVSMNQQLSYNTRDSIDEDRLNSLTTLSGGYKKEYLRLQSNYQISPESELQSILASYRHRFNNKLDLTLEAEKRYQQSLSEFSAKLDWQAGFARISPRVTYNTDKDFFAGLTTRFGILKPPGDNLHFFDRNVSSTGGLSAFVYFDENGDGEFNEGEKPLEGVVVKAPQNGGRMTTDEHGVALFSRMRELLQTDIYIDDESLQDPSWVSGYDGVSILPRNGHVATVEFPIHLSGELDGTLYLGDKASVSGDADAALRNVKLALYNNKGEMEQTAITDTGGFYYFSRIPPGRYLLIIDENDAQNGKFVRPMPQEVEIGYDGTVIYGNDIYVDGGADVPSEIVADNKEDLKALYPDIDFSQDYDLVLNFGEYNSQLMVSLVWYKMRTRYNAILAGTDLFVPPSKSLPEGEGRKHILRVGLANSDLKDAYKRCRAMIARDQFCKVEIYPSYLEQASLDAAL